MWYGAIKWENSPMKAVGNECCETTIKKDELKQVMQAAWFM